MKKIKYLLALCLSIVCIGAINVSAATIDTTMAEEIALFENLGFTLPEKSAETDLVTRGEFLGTLTQYFNREFAPGGEYSFSDVPKSDALSGALNYAVAMGIVSDGDMFYPGDNVTYKQAMKMAVTFLGRGLEAEAAGGYDAGGYNAVASNLKLYTGLQDVAGENVTLRDFYKLLYNVGQANMYVRDIYNNIYTGNTPFVEFFNMYQIRGLVTMTENTGLKDNYVNSPAGTVAINSDIYRYDGEAPLGYNVIGWARNVEGDMREILILKEHKNTTTEISLVELEGRVEDNYFYHDVNGKDERIKIKDPIIIYNGIAAPTMKVTDVFKCKLGTATFLDNDADGYYNVISISEYRPVVVSITSTMSMRINDKNGATAVNLNESVCNNYTIVKDGVPVEIQKLAKGDFLMVYESKKGTYVKAEVMTDSVTGVVSTVNSTARKIKIGDTVYYMSDYFNKYYASKIVPNTTISAYVTPDGVIHALTEDAKSTNKFGYIIKWWEDVETDRLKVRMANEDGEVILVTLAKSVILDGESGVKKDEVVNRLAILEGRGKANLFVKYALNDEGTELKVIDTYDQLAANTDPQNILTGNEDVNDDLKEYNYPIADTQSPNTGNFYWNHEDQGWSPYVNNIKKIFVITTADGIEDDEIFSVEDKSFIKTERDAERLKRNPTDGGFVKRAYRLFNVDKYGNCEAILFVRSEASTTISTDDARGIVYRISKASNLEGNVTYELVLYSGGVYNTYFLSEDYYTQIVNSKDGIPFANGDYIAYKVDTISDEIVMTEMVYDKSKKDLVGELTTPNYYSTRLAYITGWIYDMDGTSLSLIPSGYFNKDIKSDNIEKFDPKTGSLMGISMGSAPLNIISTDGKSISEGSMGDITTFVQSPKDAEFVILRLYEGVLQEVILYK